MPRHGQFQLARLMASLLGLSSLVGSALFAETARTHMAAIGHVCGGQMPHCGACYAAAGLALTALLASSAALRPQLRVLPIRPRS